MILFEWTWYIYHFEKNRKYLDWAFLSKFGFFWVI